MSIDNERASTQASSTADEGGTPLQTPNGDAGSWFAWGVIGLLLASTAAIMLSSGGDAGFWRELRYGLDFEAWFRS